MSAYEGSRMQEQAKVALEARHQAHTATRGMGNERFEDAPAAKPPLGVKPRDLWDEERGADLARAIGRHLDHGSIVPDDWIKELNEIVERLNARIAAKAAEYRGPG